MSDSIVVLPGRGALPPDTAVLRGDDRGVLQGDGVFETLHVRDGQPWLLGPHLDRMARSAALLELTLPPRHVLADLAAAACAAGPAVGEAALRLVCTRGPVGGDATLYATVSPLPPAVLRERHDGVRVLTASLGATATGRAALPWLLAGAKSLSYATNMAARRWATAHDADDVLWISTDGYALEAPTANLMWLSGDTLCTVPPATTGILAGVTAADALARAGTLGWAAAERMVTPVALATADAVWLTSSLRGPTPVRALDGHHLPDSPHHARLRDLLGYLGS